VIFEMTNRPIVYLAGPIRHAADPISWRVAIQQSTNEFAFHNPIDRDVRPQEDPADEIVEGDLQMIDDSDGLLVGWHDEIPSVGTAMEIHIASEQDIPVVVWQRDNSETVVSPWLAYYADRICQQRDAALWQLHGLVSGGVEA